MAWMLIRRWHPAKIAVLWSAALALLLVFSAEGLYADEAIIWFIFAIPIFIITWIWATGREKQDLSRVRATQSPAEDSVHVSMIAETTQQVAKDIVTGVGATLIAWGVLLAAAVVGAAIIYPFAVLASLTFQNWLPREYLSAAGVIGGSLILLFVIGAAEYLGDWYYYRRKRK